MKLVINTDYGGFSISRKAAEHMAARGSRLAKAELDKGGVWHGYGYVDGFSGDGYKRDDPLLVAAVEELGDEANGSAAALKVVEIPDGIEYTIEEYDGDERVAERHRTWS